MILRLAQAFTICLLAHAQVGAQPSAPHFDVASVKRYPTDQIPHGGLQREITPTSVTMRAATLGNCFEWAFGMPIYQVIGPKWLNWPTDAAYDTTARVTAPASQAELKLMMQALLIERFHLAFHRETRNLTVYAVRMAKDGPKFKLAKTEKEPSMKTTDPTPLRMRASPWRNWQQVSKYPSSPCTWLTKPAYRAVSISPSTSRPTSSTLIPAKRLWIQSAASTRLAPSSVLCPSNLVFASKRRSRR